MKAVKSLKVDAPKITHFPDLKMLADIPLLPPIACLGLIFIRERIFEYLLTQKWITFGERIA